RLLGIQHPEKSNRIYINRYVIFSDYFLLIHMNGEHAQVHSLDFINKGDEENKTGSFGIFKFTKTKDYRSLVFAQDFEHLGQQYSRQNRNSDDPRERIYKFSSLFHNIVLF